MAQEAAVHIHKETSSVWSRTSCCVQALMLSLGSTLTTVDMSPLESPLNTTNGFVEGTE